MADREETDTHCVVKVTSFGRGDNDAGDTRVDEIRTLEVTDYTTEKYVEMAFDYRRERIYLRVRLADLLAAFEAAKR